MFKNHDLMETTKIFEKEVLFIGAISIEDFKLLAMTTVNGQ